MSDIKLPDYYEKITQVLIALINHLPSEIAEKYNEKISMLQTVYTDLSTAHHAFTTITTQLYAELLTELEAKGLLTKGGTPA